MADAIVAIHYKKNGLGVTGLTVTATGHKIARANNEGSAQALSSVAEVGNGFYSVRIADVDFQSYVYLVNWSTGGDVDEPELGSMLWDWADPLTNAVPGGYEQGSAGWALGRIGRGVIATMAPVVQSGDVITYQEATYLAEIGMALEWIDREAAWPDLSEAEIAAIIEGGPTFTGEAITPSGIGKTIRLELSAEDSQAVGVGRPRFQIWANWPATEESPEYAVLLVEGKWISRAKTAPALTPEPSE